MKLEELCCYLPYGLKMKCSNPFRANYNTKPLIKGASATLTGDLYADIENNTFGSLGYFKPLLRPLSELTDEICRDNGKWAYAENIIKALKCETIDHKTFTWLCKEKFDVFNAIESGQAIDINTIK